MRQTVETCVQALEREVVEMCAPTLGSLKPAGMFSHAHVHAVGCAACGERAFEAAPVEMVARSFLELGRRLQPLGVCVTPLARRDESTLTLVWRPDLLAACCGAEPVASLLEVEGYDVRDPRQCVRHLGARMRAFDAHPHDGRAGFARFPHEVGLLLGYPLEDVVGFVRHRGRGARARGGWAVYSDVDRARRLSRLYEDCTARSLERYLLGEPIESLVCAPCARTRYQVSVAYEG